MNRKGIILAGGSSTRLYPLTTSVSKQLMPIYDKPMIYYPLSTLMVAGLREIMVITSPCDQEAFVKLLGDGSKWGISLQYAIQPEPAGIAQAFTIAENFIANDLVCLILGDNIFHGHGLHSALQAANKVTSGATVFGYNMSDPRRYGVVEIDGDGRAVTIEEKPAKPRSSIAVTGLYFYDNQVIEMAERLSPSARGELEISDINRMYLDAAALNVQLLGRGSAWLDTGTHDSLLDAAQYVRIIEERQGLKICCPEETAFQMGYIDRAQLELLAKPLAKSGYGDYLMRVSRHSRGIR